VLTVKPSGGLSLLGTGCMGNPCRVPRRRQGYGVRGGGPILPGPGAEPRVVAAVGRQRASPDPRAGSSL